MYLIYKLYLLCKKLYLSIEVLNESKRNKEKEMTITEITEIRLKSLKSDSVLLLSVCSYFFSIIQVGCFYKRCFYTKKIVFLSQCNTKILKSVFLNMKKCAK